MKRLLSCVCLLLMISMAVISPVAAQGEIVGSYVYTDIVAYINGYPINSYNINGWTGIVAEDLVNYGFDVYWQPEERTLSVGNSYIPTPGGTETELNWQGSGEVTSTFTPENNMKPIGSFAGNIYATDIKTYVSGDEVTSFNIGGRTIIYIDELFRFGDVVWHENERKICYDYVAPWNINLYQTNNEAVTDEVIYSFSLEMTKNENGEYVTTGENLDYLDYLRLSYNKKDGMYLGFSIYQRVLFQTTELSQMLWNASTVKYDGTILAENADYANEHMKISINGEPVVIKKVTQGKGNGHEDFYFWFDCGFKKDDITSVSVSFQ